jgi:putative ABC transport system substrate-binding protein
MRSLGAGIAIAVMAWATAVPPAGAADVAVVKSSEVAAWRPAIEALRRVATGHTLTEFDLRNDRTTAEAVLSGLRAKPATIVVALGPLAAQLVRTGLPDSPLVFAMVQEPAKLGLTVAPAVTGVTFAIPVKNQLAAFRMVNPKGVRVGVIYKEDNSGHQVEDAQKAAGLLHLLLVTRAVASEREIPQAVRALLSGDTIDALWVPPDPVLLGDETRRFLMSEMLKAGRPVYGSSSALVAEGALVSNGPDLASIGEQAGELVNRLAAGDHSRIDLLVPRAELVINRKIATRLKIEVPADALKAANKVF